MNNILRDIHSRRTPIPTYKHSLATQTHTYTRTRYLFCVELKMKNLTFVAKKPVNISSYLLKIKISVW